MLIDFFFNQNVNETKYPMSDNSNKNLDADQTAPLIYCACTKRRV